MTFDEWNKKHGAFSYIDTGDDERAARVGWEAALKYGLTAPEAASGRDAEFMAWARRHAPTQLAELITRREQMRSQTGKDHSQT